MLTSNTLSQPKGIEQMPSSARVWVYQSSRFLSGDENVQFEKLGQQFINSWTAHGAELRASFDIFYNLFLVIAVDEKQALASGCSIDKSVHFVKQLEQQFNIQLLDRMQVAYRIGDTIRNCHYSNLLSTLKKDGVADIENVVVFNNMVTSKDEFDAKWMVPLKESWHRNVL